MRFSTDSSDDIFPLYVTDDWRTRCHPGVLRRCVYCSWRIVPIIGLLALIVLYSVGPPPTVQLYNSEISTQNQRRETPKSNLLLKPQPHPHLKPKPQSLKFRRRPETAHVDCTRVLKGDKKYIASLNATRPALKPVVPLDMSCDAILERILPPDEIPPTSLGVAFARIVYTSYEFLEDEVRSMYHDENVFCFAIDTKASVEFKEKMKALAKCLPNVHITEDERDIDGLGHNMNFAHYDCLKVLHNDPRWKYAILLQNHDTIIKSVHELATIYGALGGANDVEITGCPSDRWDHNLTWDGQGMKLFRDESKATPTQLNGKLHFAKGAAQVSLARATVTWLVETVDLSTLIGMLNKEPFGVDEVLMESLQISDDLDMPGRFTHECLEKGHNGDFLSRMSHWRYGNVDQCATKTIRHAICVLGMEDVASLSKYPNLMANKFLPEFDYAGVECIHELLFNRTHLGQIDAPLDLNYYNNMPNVLYHKARMSNATTPLNVTCKATAKTWQEWKYPL